MDKYIKKLTEQQQRVIIPGFGAFQVVPEGGIMFNQYLNFDDGMLVGYVAEQLGISNEEAQQKVVQYSHDLKQQLDEGKTVAFDGIGSIKSVDGRYEFSENADDDGIIGSIDLSDSDEESSSEVSEPVAPVVQEETPDSTVSEPIVETSTYVYKEESSVKNIIIIVVISLLLLIGVVMCLFVINKDNCVYEFFFGDKETVEQVEPVAVPVDSSTIVKDTAVVDDTFKKINTGKRYNIVVGTYKNEAAAQKKVSQLKEKGFENAIVGTFRNNYVAIIESFDSLPEAEARQEYIVDNYRIESYITNAGE